MTFEASAIIVTGTLRNPDGTALVGAQVRLELLLTEPGTPSEVMGSVPTAEDGAFQLEIPQGSPLHQSTHVVLLQLLVDVRLVAESWQVFDAQEGQVTIDFGALSLHEAPAYSVGPRSFYGVPDGMALGGGGVSQEEHDAVVAQLTTAQSDLASTQAQLTTAQSDLATAQSDLATAQSDLTTAQSDLADAQAQIAALEAQNSTSSSLGAVVDNVGSQLKATQESLRSSGAPIQLGKISMDLKVMPSGDGSTFTFVDPALPAGVDAAVLSTVHLDFVSQAPASTAPASVTVPDLGGLTEPAVRRVTRSLGLGIKVLFQAVADDGPVEQAGRAMRQIPAAGAEVDPGSVVTVLFGKALDA